MSQAQADLVARATDPHAELTTLHTLAQNYPGLRPYIAENPRTYPALLEWLGSLGDPAVDAALARRAAGLTYPGGAGAGATQMLSSGTALDLGPGTSGANAPTVVSPAVSQAQPTVAVPASQRPGSPSQAAQPSQAYTSYQASQTPSRYRSGASRSYSGGASTPAWSPRPSSSEAGVFGVGRAEDEPARHGHALWLWLLGAVALVLVVALAVWYFLGDRDGAAGDPETVPTHASQVATAPTGAPTTEPASSPTLSPSATPSPTPSAMPYPAPEGAITLSSFTSPSGNISCSVNSDSVTCTIAEHEFTDSTCGADNSLPYTVVLKTSGTASGGCDVPGVSGAGATLNYGSAAQNGQMACTSSEAGIECWSQVTGEGFSLNRAGAYSTNR